MMFGGLKTERIWIVALIIQTTLAAQSVVESATISYSSVPARKVCRDSWHPHYYTEEDFAVMTCSKCLLQVFKGNVTLRLYLVSLRPPTTHYPYILYNGTGYPFFPDPENSNSVICREENLSYEDCEKWKRCCWAARECCQKMKVEPLDKDDENCPFTWDGVSCWSSIPPNRQAKLTCPSYFMAPDVAWASPKAKRICTANGNWYVHDEYGVEVTDYDSCFDKEITRLILKISLYIDIVGHSISVLFLITAIIIIISFRSLRRDFLARDSLRLHLNLFVAMIFAGLISSGFHNLHLLKDAKAIMESNPLWCRGLNALDKYFRSVTFFAMFMEGFYLRRRISKLMYVSTREALLKYFLASWIIPAITVSAYIITRVHTGSDTGCWMKPPHFLELIHWIPNGIALLSNIGFLCSIEINLCTKLRTDSGDRRIQVIRHALRATLSLIPVFGLQFLFIAYRPQWPPYEIISSLFTSTQGILVAILYCFSTKEVRNELVLFGNRCCIIPCKKYLPNWCRRRSETGSLMDRCIDMQGYLYVCQQHAGNSFSVQNGRRSLPDVIDSASISFRAPTRTTSLASSISDRDHHNRIGGLYRQRLSQDFGIGHARDRRPSSKSLNLPCICGACPGKNYSCTEGVTGTKNSLVVPLLGRTLSDHGSSNSKDAEEDLLEEEEEMEGKEEEPKHREVRFSLHLHDSEDDLDESRQTSNIADTML